VVDIIVSTVHAMLANTSNAMLTADSREVQRTGDQLTLELQHFRRD